MPASRHLGHWALAVGDVLVALPAEVLGALSAPEPDTAALPDRLAPFVALVDALSASFTERLLTELLARLIEPSSP